jgi:hypothetical protein
MAPATPLRIADRVAQNGFVKVGTSKHATLIEKERFRAFLRRRLEFPFAKSIVELKNIIILLFLSEYR